MNNVTMNDLEELIKKLLSYKTMNPAGDMDAARNNAYDNSVRHIKLLIKSKVDN